MRAAEKRRKLALPQHVDLRRLREACDGRARRTGLPRGAALQPPCMKKRKMRKGAGPSEKEGRNSH